MAQASRRPPPSASARQALGAVPPPWRFPISGSGRVVAIERLKRAVEKDLFAQLDALAASGWLDCYTDPDTISIIAAYRHGVVAEGVGRALDRLWAEP